VHRPIAAIAVTSPRFQAVTRYLSAKGLVAAGSRSHFVASVHRQGAAGTGMDRKITRT